MWLKWNKELIRLIILIYLMFLIYMRSKHKKKRNNSHLVIYKKWLKLNI